MSNDILDNHLFEEDNEDKQYRRDDALKAIKKGGYSQSFHMKTGAIVIQQRDGIKASIRWQQEKIVIETSAPTFLSGVHLSATLCIWFSLSWISLTINSSWLQHASFYLGLLGGQIFAFFWYRSSGKKLKKDIISILEE